MAGAVVELLESEDTGELGVIPDRVLVNGVDVGDLAEAPRVVIGAGAMCTTVRLVLKVSRLDVRGELSPDERKPIGFSGATS